MEETEPEIETFTVPAVVKAEPVVCPGECTCTEGAVDCAGVDLMDFPSELSESTRILSLQVGHTHPTPTFSSHRWVITHPLDRGV